MWILPADLSVLHLELTPGPYLLPSHYHDEDVDQLAWLLRSTLHGVTSELRLDGPTLESLSTRKVSVPGALVVVRLAGMPASIDEMIAKMKDLGARCALVQLPEPQETGYGWMERDIKAPLYKAVGAWLAQPTHPLARFNVMALPVMDAAALTTDPVELLNLLERCVAHRLRYADIGCDASDYRRSLLSTAGQRLAHRLAELQGEALRAALEVLLWEGNGPGARDRFMAGAIALVKVGVASLVGGSLRLGPLARSISERELLGAFEATIDRNAWTEDARHKVSERNRSVDERQDEPPLATSGAVSGLAQVSFPSEELERLVGDTFPHWGSMPEPVALLRDLVSAPGFTLALNSNLQARLVRALRSLTSALESHDLRQREVSGLLSSLLKLVAARGADTVGTQERALHEIREALERLQPSWAEDLRLAALFWNASTRIRWPRTRDDLNTAESIMEECISHWTDCDRLAAAHLGLGQVAAYREDHLRAQEHYEAALRLAIDGKNRSNEAAAGLALARGALMVSSFAEAERRAKESLRYYEEVGDTHEAAVARCLLGASLSNQQRPEEAENRLDEALRVFKSTGDVAGQVESGVFLAGALWRAGTVERAETLASEAIAAATEAGLPLSTALGLSTMAAFRLAKGAIDEGAELFEQASSLCDSIGARPKSAQAFRSAAEAFPTDAPTRGMIGTLLRAASTLAQRKG